jgi:hypothetical protein
MLPSEKAERWVRRVGYAALVLLAIYILVWLARFVWGNYHKALEQRQAPAGEEFTVYSLRGRMRQACRLAVGRKL